MTLKQFKSKTMEQFYSAIRSIAEPCQLREDELIRFAFTANMVYSEIDNGPLTVNLSSVEVLELAISKELGVHI